MTNYELKKFVDLYVRKLNEKGKEVKIKFEKEVPSKAELEVVFKKVKKSFVEGYEKWLKKLKKEFKAQEEVKEWKEYVVNAKKPGKKITEELGLPSEKIVL